MTPRPRKQRLPSFLWASSFLAVVIVVEVFCGASGGEAAAVGPISIYSRYTQPRPSSSSHQLRFSAGQRTEMASPGLRDPRTRLPFDVGLSRIESPLVATARR